MEVFRSTGSFVATDRRVKEVALRENHLQGNQSFRLRIPEMVSSPMRREHKRENAAM